jgi:hypothetical protein
MQIVMLAPDLLLSGNAMPHRDAFGRLLGGSHALLSAVTGFSNAQFGAQVSLAMESGLQANRNVASNEAATGR